MEVSAEDGVKMGFGPYPVTEVQHEVIVMSDTIKLAVKYWLPSSKEKLPVMFGDLASESLQKRNDTVKELYPGTNHINEPQKFPVILEYLPYCKDGYTILQDLARHPWFASHGFVCARVDIRGSGSSEGFYYDEYSQQEMDDCDEVIKWLSVQAWCNGRIGMYGKSWGGFNGLQMAYRQPPALKTAISLYSTDNRYKNDIHYQGGTIIGNGMLSWASVMYAWNARPPCRRWFTSWEDWEKAWRGRLEKYCHSWLSTWLSSQHRDDAYWKHGSIDQDYSRIICPILIIGGLLDGYTPGAMRMAAMLNKDCRAIVGPWTHDWPDTSSAGPNIDFLGTCLSWFNFHLKSPQDADEDVLAWPRLRLFIRDSICPKLLLTSVPGKFVNIPKWPQMYQSYLSEIQTSDFHSPSEHLKYMYFNSDGVLSSELGNSNILNVPLVPKALQGAESAFWLSFGYDNDVPGDQSVSNENSHCWMTPVLDRDIVIAGFSTLFLALSSHKRGKFSVQVNICDVWEGKSLLVTRGCQNLSQADCSESGDWSGDFPADQVKVVRIELDPVGHCIKSGHQLLVSISPSYFPIMWPAVDTLGLVMHPKESYFVYQTLPDSELLSTHPFPPPLLLAVCTHTKGCSEFSSKMAVDSGTYKFTVHSDSGTLEIPGYFYNCREVEDEVYSTDVHLTYATAERKHNIILYDEYGRPISIQTALRMTGNKHTFKLEERLEASGPDCFKFSHSSSSTIPRKFV